MNTVFLKLQDYVPPKITVITIDSQSMLASSGNPSITNPPMEWGTQKNEFPWENTEINNE